MGRLAASNLTEVSAASLRPVVFVRLAYPSGSLYLCDVRAPGLTYGGQTYTCDGTLLGLSPFMERADGKVGNCEITLSYANSTLLTYARDDNWHYSVVEIALGFLNSSMVLVTTPDTLGNWFMSHHEIDTTGATIRLTAEPAVIDLRRPKLVTSSDADQQKRYSGDTIFKFTASLEEKEIEWGGKRAAIGHGGGAYGIGAGWGGSFGLWGTAGRSYDVYDGVGSGSGGTDIV